MTELIKVTELQELRNADMRQRHENRISYLNNFIKENMHNTNFLGMTGKVVHCRKEPYDIYIGRKNGDLPQSKWANPFVVGKDCKRGECIDMYREWIMTQPQLLADLHELEGKVLGCWCKPKNCHGDVLLDLLKKKDIIEY